MKLLILCAWVFGIMTVLVYAVSFFALVFGIPWHRKRSKAWCDCQVCTAKRVEANNREYDLAHFDLQEFISR